jgi:cytochrome c-type biogenesis protein CcmE
MTRKQRRLTLIGTAGVVLLVATVLILTALDSTITFFKSPTAVLADAVKPGTRLKVGGLVESGSVVKSAEQRVRFAITDGNKSIAVTHVGILPDLFREGQGVITEGTLQADGTFAADTVLAKHDERYMPREVVDTLKQQGQWHGDAPAPGAAAAKTPGEKTQ